MRSPRRSTSSPGPPTPGTATRSPCSPPSTRPTCEALGEPATGANREPSRTSRRGRTPGAGVGRADHGDADQHPPARRGVDRPRLQEAVADGLRGSCARWTRSSRPTGDDSDLMRLRREEVELSQCSPLVDEALRIGQEAEVLTRGAFTTLLPTGDGDLAFDPTGLVKGWAVDRAARCLARRSPGISFCINAGGDLLVVRARRLPQRRRRRDRLARRHRGPARPARRSPAPSR